jgi:CAAX prenyl protease-like protein
MSQSPATVTPHARRSPLSDDWSYLAPMLLFLAFTEISSTWPALLPPVYLVKTILTALLLVWCWPAFTRVEWSSWGWGIVVGVIGVVQWIAMEKWLLHVWPHYPRMSAPILDPYADIPSTSWRMVFLTVRWLGPTLVVPFMEELFWRDYLWRTFIAPADFKLACIGEYDARALWLVPVCFATVHMQIWMTALVWALMIGLLLLRSKSLGACIIAHGLTNFLLGAWVLWKHDWMFW